MGARRRFTAEYKREAVAMLDVPRVTVSQIASDLGIGANILGRWRRELRQAPKQAFAGNGRPRDEEVSQLRRELARMTKERDFLREAVAFFAKRRNKVSDDPAMPRRIPHPIDVPVFTGVGQRVLRLGGSGAECADPGE